VLGVPAAQAGITFAADDAERGLTEIVIAAPGREEPVEIGGVRFRFEEES